MKKRLFLLLSLFLTIISAKADEVAFSVPDFTIEPGETKEISLIMTSTSNDMKFNFGGEMILSEGLTFVQTEFWDDDEEEYYYMYALRTDRLKKKHAIKENLKAPNDLSFVVSAGLDFVAFKAGDAVLTFKVKAAEDMALGTASVQLKGMNAAGEEAVPLVTEPDYTATVTVTKKVSVSVASADENKGTVTGAGSYDSGAEATVTATPTTGYEFVNWTFGEEEVSKENPYTFTVTEDVSLTANFQAATYTITYHPGDGATFTTEKNSYTIESEDITLDEPTMTGYDFGGWYDNAEFTGEAITKITKGSTGNKEFYAKWTETSSIKALFRDSKAVNVYTVGGTLVGRDMTVGEVLQLKRGIYVINGKKIVVK